MHKNTRKKVASTTDILGKGPIVVNKPEAPKVCFCCNTKLTGARVKALKHLHVAITRWTCVSCANTTTPKKLGIFMGEVGTSELKIVDRIDTETVRDIFLEPDAITGEEN